ncbi:hypothetical protein GGX14DRAFT_700134 [Mycena pura]|uniref:F-box domain-containing protein n=1 Tax=Mycena pura TaxID=153505 RepID=A0AAD6UZB3_9AGAR|nr:hypothetical protein GGX14DRAFT_700134 [Mycena pura]
MDKSVDKGKRARIAAIRNEVVALRLSIEVLEAEERDLESDLATVVYPVLTLPNEITSRIFLQCLPSHGRVRPSPRKAPLILAQICRQWREIALSTSEMWCSIDLSFQFGYIGRQPNGREYGDIPNDGATPLLLEWLSRTKGRPTSLTLRSRHGQLSSQILAAIRPFAIQSHRLELMLTPQDCHSLFAVSSDSSVAFLGLRDLAVHCYSRGPSAQSLASIFKAAPVLRTLRILTDPDAFLPLFSYPRLNSLELRDTSMLTLLDALIQFPQLSHIKACLNEPINVSGRPYIHTAPYLQSLILSTYCGFTAPADPVLDWLTLPNLRRLELDHEPQFHVLSSFLTRSSCVLEHLGLSITTREQIGELPDIWQKCPSITSLEINADEYILEFVMTLTIHVNRWPDLKPSPLPCLRALTVTTWKLDFGYELLMHCLRDTMDPKRHPLPLQSFHLKLCHDPSDTQHSIWLPSKLIQAELGRIVAEGIDIRITTPGVLYWPDKLNYVEKGETFP